MIDDDIAADLVRVATGEVPHLYQGACPDAVEGHDSRDPLCPACRLLIAAELEQPPPFSYDEPSPIDKSFLIHGPGDLTLEVDYDDVDHEEVLADAARVVRILNEHWPDG